MSADWWLTAAEQWKAPNSATDFQPAFRSRRCCSIMIGREFGEIVLLLDGDATGRAATRQIASDLAMAFSVMPLLLPPGMQPDQMAADEIRLLIAGKEWRLTIGAN
jgi:hypothetical protein